MKTSLLVSAFLFTSLSAALARPFDFNSILNAGGKMFRMAKHGKG